jgi:hypothetical protein
MMEMVRLKVVPKNIVVQFITQFNAKNGSPDGKDTSSVREEFIGEKDNGDENKQIEPMKGKKINVKFMTLLDLEEIVKWKRRTNGIMNLRVK